MPEPETIPRKGWFEILMAGAIWGALIDLLGTPLGQFIIVVWVPAPFLLYLAYSVARARGSRFRWLHFSSRDFNWVLASTVVFAFVLWLPMAVLMTGIFAAF